MMKIYLLKLIDILLHFASTGDRGNLIDCLIDLRDDINLED